MIEDTPIIIALDFPNAKLANSFLDRIQDRTYKLKVGLELFISEGPRFVEQLAGKGHQVFLDLKLHDIPNTVASACKSVSNLGAWMVTLHAAGGSEMLKAAHETMSGNNHATKLIAVTALTSLDQQQLNLIGVQQSSDDYVLQLATLALQSKLDGIVCSALEAHTIRNKWGAKLMIVTPGIRLQGDNADDQNRVAAPFQARQSGANYIVVGRPITQAKDPIIAIDKYIANWSSDSN